MNFRHNSSYLRWCMLLGIAVLCLGGVFYHHKSEEEHDAHSEQPAAVSTAAAAITERHNGLRLTGTVEGLTSAIISSRYPGQVEAVLVENGQHVESGQVLIRTDRRELLNNLQIAENGVRKANVNYENVSVNHHRNQHLYKIGAVSKQICDSSEVQLAVSRADVDDAAATLRIAREKLKDATVTSPVNGVVANKAVNLGQMVSEGAQLMTVEQIDAVYVTVQVQQQDIARVQIGTRADVKVDAFPGRSFAGAVAVINPVAGRVNRLFDVKVRVENSDFSLKPGMFAEVSLNGEGGTVPVLTVPRSALTSRKGQNYVFIITEDHRARRVRVETGELMDDRLEIRSGLQEGSRVILDNLDQLKDGDPVKAHGGDGQ